MRVISPLGQGLSLQHSNSPLGLSKLGLAALHATHSKKSLTAESIPTLYSTTHQSLVQSVTYDLVALGLLHGCFKIMSSICLDHCLG